MLFDAEDPNSVGVRIFNKNREQIRLVKKYNTETREAVIVETYPESEIESGTRNARIVIDPVTGNPKLKTVILEEGTYGMKDGQRYFG